MKNVLPAAVSSAVVPEALSAEPAGLYKELVEPRLFSAILVLFRIKT